MITDEMQKKEGEKRFGEEFSRFQKDQQKKATRKMVVETIKAILMPILIKALILLPIIIVLFSIVDLLSGGNSASGKGGYDEGDFSSIGTVSAFGCELSRDEFIEAVENYNGGPSYNTYMVPYADDFYDVCSEYNVNPCLAFAHACIETGWGSSDGCKNNKNYFGFAHYNTSNSGASYSSVGESVRAYCEWVVDSSTEGTSLYSQAYNKGKEYAQENNKLKGTPANNIYVLYCPYAYLGDTHISDEPDFDNPAGLNYYTQNGSNSGTGGRYYIYYMYESGGLYENKYKELCGHSNGSDETTIQEKADYQVYTTNQRINIAKNIFGENAFVSSNFYAESIVEAAVKCHEYLRTNGYKYAQAGVTIPEGVLNGSTIDCSSFVTWVLYCAGYAEMAGYQQTSYTFENNSWGWEEISLDEAGPGDIVIYDGHVEIIAEVGDTNNLRVYNCGSNISISAIGTDELPESGMSGRSKSQITKILRPSTI